MIVGGLAPRDVTYVVEQAGACAWYRCRTPGVALTAAGYRIDMTNQLTSEMVKASRVIVWQRPSRPQSLKDIRIANAIGVRTVVEMDDDLWNIAHGNPAWRSWNEHGGARLHILAECIRAASIVTVTTPALADSIRFLNRRIVVLPNMLPAEFWPAPVERRPRKGVVIGWAGSSSHVGDLNILRGVVETALLRYPHARFEFCGMPSLPFPDHKRLSILPPVATPDYRALLARFDIGLAPVVDTRFNRAKSDLKYLEYAACGIPTIASHGVTYASLEHGVTGYRARSGADWLKAMDALVADAGKRRAMGAAARLYAESRFVTANVTLWQEAYGLVTIFKESELAHELCIGKGIEIGGSAHNPFGLDTINVDITGDMTTRYKDDEREMCGHALAVDVVAPGDALPFADGSQDFVVSSHVLEHFTDPIKALLEWDRVVRVGGVIFAIVPHKTRTFDRGRPCTTRGHVIKDWRDGCTEPHDDAVQEHNHVWVTSSVVAIIDWLRENAGVSWEWLAVRDTDDKVGNGFMVAVRKTGARP